MQVGRVDGDMLLDDVLGEVVLVDMQGADLLVRMLGAAVGNNTRRTAGHLRVKKVNVLKDNTAQCENTAEELTTKEQVANPMKRPFRVVDLTEDSLDDRIGGGKTSAETSKIANSLLKLLRAEDPQNLNWRYQKREYAEACAKHMNGVFAPKGFRSSVVVCARTPPKEPMTGSWLRKAGVVALARHMQFLPFGNESTMTRTTKKKKEHEMSFLAETVIRSEGNNNSGVEVIGLRMDDKVVLPAVFCLLLELNVSPEGEEELRIMGEEGAPGSSDTANLRGANLLLHNPLMIVWAGAGVKSFYRASPQFLCKWDPRDEGQRALTNCLKEEFKKHCKESDAYSCLRSLALTADAWTFRWESLEGIPDVIESYSSEEGRLRELSSNMQLESTKVDELTFNELLALNNWRSDELNKVFGVIDFAVEKERNDQQKRDDESARNRLKYAANALTAAVVNEEFNNCKSNKAVDDLLEQLRARYTQAESAGSERGYRPDQIEAAAKEQREDKKAGKTRVSNNLKKAHWYQSLQNAWETVQQEAEKAKSRLASANGLASDLCQQWCLLWR